MKKKYVVPESRLFAINMSESIAASGFVSEVAGSAIIKFTQLVDGCRELYTGDSTAPVKVTTNTFMDYYNELLAYNNMSAYFTCFRYSGQ